MGTAPFRAERLREYVAGDRSLAWQEQRRASLLRCHRCRSEEAAIARAGGRLLLVPSEHVVSLNRDASFHARLA
jgi:hypothetical protein